MSNETAPRRDDDPQPEPGGAPPPRGQSAPRPPGHGRHSHSRSATLDLEPSEARTVRLVLASLVVPLVIATVVGLVVLWPGGGSLVGSQPFTAEGSSMETATVTSLDTEECLDATQALGGVSDGSFLQDAVCARITSGQGEGLTMPVHIPAESLRSADVGDELHVMYTPEAVSMGTPYVFVDYGRGLPVAALAIVYLVLVVAVAGRKGALSVLGLVVATAVLVLFMIPALLAGTSPLAVALVGSMAMMLAAVYVAHGVSVRTTTALLGTVAGVLLTVALSLWGTDAASLTGSVDETATVLSSLVKGINLQTLLTCGMVVAALGVLNDVTITQASAVWELHAANPALSRARLFTGGMRIGRDHIASTVYTLAFAYAGTALPLILSAALIDRPLANTVLSGEIAEEVVRTLVSSIGLVLAIPATTAIAAVLCRTTSAEPVEEAVREPA